MLRALSRLGLDRGGPRDLDMIRAGLEAADEIAADACADDGREAIGCSTTYRSSCAATLRTALADELPLLKRDGGFVPAGYDHGLDEARGCATRAAR